MYCDSYPLELNGRRFKVVEGDMDSTVSVRTFSGRITKGRWKKLASICRAASYRTHCGCEHDCCGCVFSEQYSFEYALNQVKITHRMYRNY